MKKEFASNTILSSVWIPTVMAAGELHAGDPARAIELLNTAKSLEPGADTFAAIYTRAMAYLQTKSGSQDAGEFQKLLDHRPIAAMFYPLSTLGLARAYALAGDLLNARKSYQDFFVLWRDADPDVPALIQAKQEYAKLPQ